MILEVSWLYFLYLVNLGFCLWVIYSCWWKAKGHFFIIQNKVFWDPWTVAHFQLTIWQVLIKFIFRKAQITIIYTVFNLLIKTLDNGLYVYKSVIHQIVVRVLPVLIPKMILTYFTAFEFKLFIYFLFIVGINLMAMNCLLSITMLTDCKLKVVQKLGFVLFFFRYIISRWKFR